MLQRADHENDRPFDLNGSVASLVFFVQAASRDISLGKSYQSATSDKDAPIEVNVYLPKSYLSEADKTYPTLYVIDGGIRLMTQTRRA